MKIATYNVRVDTDYDQEWQWSYRKDYVLALINYHQWAIVGLQELRPNQVADLAQLNDYAIVSAERDGDENGEGLAICYKEEAFDLLEKGHFWLSDTPEIASIHEGAGCKRICLWSILQEKASGNEFLVLNTHLDHISEAARYAGMQVILTRMQDKIQTYPTILLGDFNAEPTEAVHELVLSQGFVNTKTATKHPHYGPFGSFQDFKYTKPWNELEEIDYIYLLNGSVKTSGTLTDSCDNRYPSDHFPLEATINEELRK
ncbi:endonuclease [Enterococcus sp. JM4C]|uniref:endonuclease/exonuclease/phosphatase family protein n=1 Tax=Candidatus Enterococcus huntleyi TaxID=1857217 RepID=UPI0013797500|nr:endonuclease/exonuclease/phosphatase family protein [Enterococcus sp. JM4C]KAF1297507.1 endonuclease [Enterococcus sp. JM4C]